MTAATCHACGYVLTAADLREGEEEPFLHRACRLRYPDSLLKAISDPFDYALRLRTGEILYFYEATIFGDFVHLDIHRMHADAGPVAHACAFDRGVDVRASDIVWCADAPWGS